jgi:catechol 2,3-dioxygenase-like lactoylglutathione lyase family enzyme
MLGLIVSVTVSAPDLAAAIAAYQDCLDYSVVERGTISAELAAVWGASRMAGRHYALLQPASRADVYLRLVENDAVAGFGPMQTFGWNANEILTEDPDAMADRLADSAFQVIGSPANLSTNENIRAMQAVGPAEEVIYLTRLPPEGGDLGLGSAQSFVDRTFIVVVGGPDMAAMHRFYHGVLGLSVTEPVGARVRLLSRAHGLDVEHRHPLSMARLPGPFSIEIDEYPASATTRPERYKELPPGIAMVAFTTPSLDAIKEHLLAPPVTLATAPYHGSRAGVVRGPAGELIELVERPN